MSQIFISYAREDQTKVERFVKALEDKGWDVWWDRTIPIGQTYDQTIQEALDAATCVVVVWTKHGTASPWVRDEAQRAAKMGKIFPITFEEVELPIGFGLYQVADLTTWDGVSSHEGLTGLIKDLSAACPPQGTENHTKPISQASSISHPLINSKLFMFTLLLAVPLVGLGIISRIHLSEARIQLEATASELSFVSTKQQEVSQLTRVSSFEIVGLKELYLPRSKNQSGQTFKQGQEWRGVLQLTVNNEEGQLTLAPVSLQPDNTVRLTAKTQANRYGLSMHGPPTSLRLTLQGLIQITLPGQAPMRRDFGQPKPLMLYQSSTGLDMDITFPKTSFNLIPTPLAITQLSLFRRDERVLDDRVQVEEVSTIQSASIQWTDLDGRSQILSPKTILRLKQKTGRLQTLDLQENGLHLEFEGEIQKIQFCSSGSCTNAMPSVLEWIWTQYTIPLLLGITIYLTTMILGVRRWATTRL